MKRAFDIIMAALGLVLLSPLMILIALLIKLTSPGPIFYGQERVGRNFKPFRIWKFRSMVPHADRIGGLLTAGRDPRITPVGAFLRKTKLDELPQLWNVLVGDMSFVGPRPEVRRYVEYYRQEYEHILQVRPGITDPASLKYRHESEILGQCADPEHIYLTQILPDKIALARQYIQQQSLWYDLMLIMKTILHMPG